MEGSKTCPVRPEDEAQQPGVQNMAWGLLTTAREVQPEWGPKSPCKSVGGSIPTKWEGPKHAQSGPRSISQHPWVQNMAWGLLTTAREV